MADQKDQTDPKDQQTQSDPDPQEAFWNEFEGRMDKWFDKKVDSYRKGNPDQSRTGGRTSIPKLISDVFIGQGR